MPHSARDNPLTRPRESPQPEINNSTLNRPKIDQKALNSGSRSAPTVTTDSSLRSCPFRVTQDGNEDEEMSSTSAYLYRTDLDASRLLREVEGRTFNTLNETYSLPSDESEWTRLNKRHVALFLALGGLYPAADTVDAILAPQSGKQKTILDLGTGTGIWAIDMAKKFPHAEVIGIDLAPVPVDSETIPPNCQFEIDDVELGLSHFQKKFDLIHARLLAMGLKNSRKSMMDIHNCLKPGGLVIWIEPDHRFFTPDVHVYRPLGSDVNPTGTWIGRIIYEMGRAGMRVSKNDLASMEAIMDGGMWGDSLIDPETWRNASLYLPIGTWANHEDPSLSQRLKYIGALNRQDLYEAHRMGRVLLERAGWPTDTLSDWARRASEEMSTMMVPVQSRFRIAWGRRRMAPGKPAPPLPPVLAPADKEGGFAPFPPYPLYYVYTTQEQALAEGALRNRSREHFTPPPLPS